MDGKKYVTSLRFRTNRPGRSFPPGPAGNARAILHRPLFEHATTAGAATEHRWLDLFESYLPQRYRSAPAFVIDSLGRRSRQIDLVVFDNLYSPPLFPHESALHVPAESVYAVFEIKQTFSTQSIRDAMEKASSVRALSRTSVPIIGGGLKHSAIRPRRILAGLLAAGSVWITPAAFAQYLPGALLQSPSAGRLDLGCSLAHGAFDRNRVTHISPPEDALLLFILRLLHRLRAMGTAPAADFMKYARTLPRPLKPI